MKEVKFERERKILKKKLWPDDSEEEGDLKKTATFFYKLELLEAIKPSAEELEDKFGCSDILDYMQAYYEVSRTEMRSTKMFVCFV